MMRISDDRLNEIAAITRLAIEHSWPLDRFRAVIRIILGRATEEAASFTDPALAHRHCQARRKWLRRATRTFGPNPVRRRMP